MTEPRPERTASTEVVQARPAPAGSARGTRGTSAKGTAPKKPGILPTVFVGLASFAVLFEFLAFQLSTGNDPALSNSALGSSGGAKVARVDRPVIHRRVIKTKVVHLPAKPDGSDSVVPVVSGSSAPAPAPAAPAPAPPPAPVTASS